MNDKSLHDNCTNAVYFAKAFFYKAAPVDANTSEILAGTFENITAQVFALVTLRESRNVFGS